MSSVWRSPGGWAGTSHEPLQLYLPMAAVEARRIDPAPPRVILPEPPPCATFAVRREAAITLPTIPQTKWQGLPEMKRRKTPVVCQRWLAISLNTLWSILLSGTLSVVLADPVPVLTLTLANGDQVSGKFVAASPDRVEIETTYAGRISVVTSEIKNWQTPDEKLRQQIASSLLAKAGVAKANSKPVTSTVKKPVAPVRAPK